MKRPAFILSVAAAILLILFIAQNRFLIGLPFVHTGADMHNVIGYMGNAEYGGDIGYDTNTIYFVRFYPLILATVNVNINLQGTYASDGATSTIGHPINSIKWT